MPATLTITMTDAGTIEVNGLLQNKLMAYGMLALAADVIREYAEQNKQRVQPVTMMPILGGPTT